MINAPSLANCSLMEMGGQVDELVEGGVNFFHIDIMDGHYVPNLCLPVRVISDLKKRYPQAVADVHLMVDQPISYFAQLKQHGADYVSFHIDSTSFVRRALAEIRALGMKAGVVMNPSQRIDLLEPYIHLVDYVVLMSVEPGFAGQKFLPGSLERLEELCALRSKYQAQFLISIDGGITPESAAAAARLGAEIFVTNIYTVFEQPDGIVSACRRFAKTIEDALLPA